MTIEKLGTRPTGNGGPYSAQSRLGAHAPTTQRTGRSLPFSDERHLQAHHWLVEEAYSSTRSTTRNGSSC